MKFCLLASVSAVPFAAEKENFITSGNVEWDLRMDSVMGGGSVAEINVYDDRVYMTGQLDLINGGFASFYGEIESKLTGFDGLRVSGRTPDPERVFEVYVSREFDGTWYHPLALEKEYKSFEVNFSDFYFSYHGNRPDFEVSPPVGSVIRKVGVIVADKRPEVFEVEVNIIEGHNF